MDSFIRSLLGFMGIIKKTLKFDTSQNDEFKKSISVCAIILTHTIDSPLDNAIDAATDKGEPTDADAAWSHSSLYVGKTWGNIIRKLVPAFLLNPKIPKEALENEIVEAQGDGIKCSSLDLGNDKVQMVAYQREYTFLETVRMLTRAYLNVGKNYGYLDFIANAFPDAGIPNVDPGFICSALTTDAHLPVERIALPGVELWKIHPNQQNDFFRFALKFQKLTWNWVK
jgi:hypothetical protein